MHDPERLTKIVRTGFTPPFVTCSEPSITRKFGCPQTRPQGSVTEVAGSVPIRQVPAWCWPLLGTTFSGWEA
jgi:hypothetical protein